MNVQDKTTWASIVQSYKGHYGVHMNPCTPYLHCHKLLYSDYTLLETMKDYQWKAPEQLSNDYLIFYKVPFKLRTEGSWGD